jgi:hypothetical protein
MLPALEHMRQSISVTCFPSGVADQAVDDLIEKTLDRGFVPENISKHMSQRMIRIL